MVRQEDLKAYFKDARSWSDDRLRAAERSKKVAWCIASAACLALTAACLALAGLAPLKTTEPFVVMVDGATGMVDVLPGLKDQEGFAPEEAVTRYFLGRYVRTREGYVHEEREQIFREVAIMSDPSVQQAWTQFFSPSNPASPQLVYGLRGTSAVKVRSISFISKDVANVRFQKVEKKAKDIAESNWIATLTFHYVNAPMTEADRLINPLGFQVVNYRSDPEVVR